MRIFLIFALCLVTQFSFGLENTVTFDTQLEIEVSKSMGSELGPRVEEAWKMVKQNRLYEALSLADDTIESLSKFFDNSKKQYAFQTDIEYDEYTKINGDNFQRIDWSYRDTLQVKAFIYSGRKSFEKALIEIAKIESIAPISVGTMIEKGYILGQQRQFVDAYETYQKAIELSDKYLSQVLYKPAALRGKGFILIELGKLDEAEKEFKKSLILEPNNKIAISELAYIAGLRGKK